MIDASHRSTRNKELGVRVTSARSTKVTRTVRHDGDPRVVLPRPAVEDAANVALVFDGDELEMKHVSA